MTQLCLFECTLFARVLRRFTVHSVRIGFIFALHVVLTVLYFTALQWHTSRAFAQSQRDDFPQFIVPGHEQDMADLQDLFHRHHASAFSDCTLWDTWLPHATLWPAVGPNAQQSNTGVKRQQYRESFLRRRIDSEGYVSMQQHRGMAHSEGWPFPAWQQSTGSGWHFSIADEVWAIQNFALKPLTSTSGWEIEGGEFGAIDGVKGLTIRATSDEVIITTPKFRCGTIVAPFLRMEWAVDKLVAGSQSSINWLLEGETQWQPERWTEFPIPSQADVLQYSNIPMYRQPAYAGLLRQYRIKISKANGATISLKSLLTSIDTRHPITDANFVRGSAEYFAWTGDVAFLQANIARMRTAMAYAIKEFRIRENNLVQVAWVGHDGRSGLEKDSNGKNKMRVGLGVGNNYWDLLPFGGNDALATIYHYDAIRKMADVEKAIETHPEWNIPIAAQGSQSSELTLLATAVKDHASEFFWDNQAGRFIGWQDLTGKRFDYGFTFVNTEAIFYGLAKPEQARRIYEWLDGKRVVAGDTSQGSDIYHWRFGARSTTLRNVETYVWAWNGPESIPWGGQVQDGGAVLGFSYFDLMARLRTLGPDDAWARLKTIIDWYREVQSEGGYRAYYAKPGRGTLQGGGPAGGLGMDQEFMESVLVSQVILYGFLGCEPLADGLRFQPNLPKAFPELSVTRVHYRDNVLDLKAKTDELHVTIQVAGSEPFKLWLQNGSWQIESSNTDASGVTGNGTKKWSVSADELTPVVIDPKVGNRFIINRLP